MAESKAVVAVLVDDQNEAKNFSNLFNQMGFLSKCYDDLEVFWHGVNNEKVSLAIIDVKMMSKGETVLKNHPKIKNEELPVVFYYTPETSPLLLSTYEILNYGLIKKSQNYSGQFKGILKRINQYWKFKGEEREYQKKLKELEDKLTSLGSVRIYNSFLYLEGENSFFDIVERVFESWPDITKYSFLALEKNGKKIISPKQKGLKYHYLGEINQGRANLEGIDPSGQKDCFSLVEESFGRGFVALKIKTQKKYPEILILLTTKSSLDGFGWENFEKFLSGIFASYKLKENFFETQSKEMINSWELFDLLDENLSIHAKKLTLVDLNLSSVIYFLMKENRFDWKKFLTDFILPLKKRLNCDFSVTLMGHSHVAFLIDWTKGNELFDLLREINVEFPYYNYFDNKEPVLGSGVKGEIKMIPSSVKAYLRYLFGESDVHKEINAF
jgi:hypothetical protein